MDYLDIAVGRFFSTFTGKYYETKPLTTLYPSISQLMMRKDPVIIDYEIIDPHHYQYRPLLQNLMESDSADCTIKTRTAASYKPNGLIILADGSAYAILTVTEDARAASREASRLMPLPVGVEYILRLVGIENPRGTS